MTLAFSVSSSPALALVGGAPAAASTPASVSWSSSGSSSGSPFAHLRHDVLIGLGALMVLLGVITFAVVGQPRGVAGASAAPGRALTAVATRVGSDAARIEEVGTVAPAADAVATEAALAFIAGLTAQAEQQASDARAQQAAEAAATERAGRRATPVASSAGRAAPVAATGGVWDRLAQCESGGDWSIDTGNGFSGGLQFLRSTWLGAGGGEYAPDAHLATREQQIDIASRVQASQGWGAWPGCSAMLGLR